MPAGVTEFDGVLKITSKEYSRIPYFRKKVTEHIRTRIRRQRDYIISRIEEVSRSIVERYLRDHPVFKNLSNGAGKGLGKDLEAEFGLRPGQGTEKAEKLLAELLKFVNVPQDGLLINPVNDLAKFKFQVELNLMDKKLYPLIAKEDGFSYDSPLEKKERRLRLTQEGRSIKSDIQFKIEWLKWIFEAHRGISTIRDSVGESILAYGILYEMNAKQRAASRSKRAIMKVGKAVKASSVAVQKVRLAAGKFGGSTDAEKAAEASGTKLLKEATKQETFNGFPYAFPDGAKSIDGYENFVEDVKHNREMQILVRKFMGNVISEALAKRI